MHTIIWANTLYIKGGNAQSMKTNHGLCMWGEIVLIFNPHPKYIFKYYESPNCPKLCNISAGIIWEFYPQSIAKIANMADIWFCLYYCRTQWWKKNVSNQIKTWCPVCMVTHLIRRWMRWRRWMCCTRWCCAPPAPGTGRWSAAPAGAVSGGVPDLTFLTDQAAYALYLLASTKV